MLKFNKRKQKSKSGNTSASGGGYRHISLKQFLFESPKYFDQILKIKNYGNTRFPQKVRKLKIEIIPKIKKKIKNNGKTRRPKKVEKYGKI